METATSQQRPRFRSDLVAQQLEEGGVQYVDVTDPNSGNTFRFYDVEYSIACGMNGERDLDQLAEWARADLGIDTSPEELSQVMTTLADLGYLEGAGVELGEPGNVGFVPERPAPVEGIELGPPGTNGAGNGHATSTVTSGVELELGPPGGTPSAPPPPVEGIELGAPGMRALSDADVAEDSTTNVAAKPPRPPGSDDDMSFEGMLDDIPSKVGPRPQPPNEVAAKAPQIEATTPARQDQTPTRPIELTAEEPDETTKRPRTAKLEGDEDTNLPGAAVEPDDDEAEVSVDLSAHISLDKKEVEEAVRASKVMMVPEIPADLLKEDSVVEEAPKAPPMPLPAPPKTSQLEALSDEQSARAPGVSATPLPPPPTATASRPIEPSKTPAAATTAKSGGGNGALWLVLLLLVGGGGFAVWYFLLRTPAEPTGVSAPEKPTPATGQQGGAPEKPAGGTPAGTPGGEATPPARPVAKLEEQAGASIDVKVPAAGRVAWVVPAGQAVAQGEPVVKFQGFQKWEQQRNNAAARLDYYQKKMEAATAANNAAGAESAQRKVDEKKGLLTEAEGELTKLVIVAPASGNAQMTAKVGAAVEAGTSVGAISGGGPQLVAVFDAGEAAAAYKDADAKCELVAKGHPDKRSACVVDGVEGTKVTVRAVDGSPFKAGDDVELAAAR